MAQRIYLKKSSVVDRTPQASSLEFGELTVNYASGTGKAFLAHKKYDGTIAKYHEDAYNESVYATKSDLSSIQSSLGNYATKDMLRVASGAAVTSAYTMAKAYVDSAIEGITIGNYLTVESATSVFNGYDSSISNIQSRLGSFALSATVKSEISALTKTIEDDEYVIAQAFNDVNDRLDAVEGSAGDYLTVQSATSVISDLSSQIGNVATRANSAFNYTAAVSATVKNNYWTTADTISKIGAASGYAYNQATAYTNDNYVKTTAYTEYTGTVANTLSKLQGGVNSVSGAVSAMSSNVVTYINDKLSTVYVYKGSVNNFSDLPTTGHVTGYVYNVVNANGNIPAGTNYAWNGSSWDALGGSVDLSNYATTDTVSQISNLANSLKTGLSAWTYANAATHTEVANASSHTLTSAATSATSIATEKANAAAQSALTRANAYTDEKTESLNGIQSTVNSLKTGLSAWTYTNAATHTEVANASSHTLTSAATSATSIATEKANAAAQSALTRANAYTDTKTQPIADLQSDVSNLKTGLSAWTHNNAATHTEVANASSHTLTSAATSAASIATAKANDAAQSALTRANKYTDDKTAGLSQMASDISTALIKANSAFNYTAAVSATVKNNYWTTGDTLAKINSASANAYTAATAYTDNNYVKKSTYNTFTGDTNSTLSSLRQGVNFLSGATSGLSANVVTYIDNKLSTVYVYKGSVQNYSNLPETGKTIGFVYNVVNANGNIPAGTNYAWNGTAWDALGGSVDLSGYATTGTVNDISSSVNSLKTGLSAWTYNNAATHTEVANASSHTLTSAVTSANSIAIAKANDAAQSALTRANAYTDAKTAPISEIQNSITNINNRLANVALSARVDTLIDNLTTVIEDNEVVMAAALTDLDSRIKNFSGSFLTVQSANTVITSLNNQVSTLNGTVSTHTNQISRLTANSGSLQNQVTQLTNNSGTMNTTLTSHTTSINTHTNQIAQLSSNSGTMASSISTLNTNVTNLTRSVSQLTSNSGTMQNTITEHTRQISRLTTNSGSMQTTITNHTNQIAQLITNSGAMASTLSSKANSSDVVTALGTNGNNVTWTKNGTTNNLTVPYASTVARATFGDSSNGTHDANAIKSNGLWYYNSNGPTTALGATTGDGALYSQAYSTSWVGQIAQDYRNGRLFVRGLNSGTWTSWLKIWDSGNFNPSNYATTATVSTIQSDVTTLKSSAATLNEKFNDYATKTEASEYAAAALGNSMAYTDSKIGDANMTLGDLGNKVSQLTTNSGSMQSTLTTLNNKVAQLNVNSGAMANQISRLTTNSGSLQNQVTQLATNSGSQANQISRLTANSGSLQNQISQLNTNSGAMASDITKLKQDVAYASSATKTLSGNVVSFVNTKISSVYKYMGTVANATNLPSSNLEIGYVYNVTNASGTPGSATYIPAGTNYAWDGSKWDPLGGTVDLSNYATTGTVNTLSNTVSTHTNQIAKLNSNSGAMASQISQLTTNSGSLQNQITRLNTNSGAMASQISRLTTNSGSLQNQVTQLTTNSGTMASDITTLKASAVTLNDKFNYYATDAEASSYAAAALSNAMDYTDSKIGGANTNITDLTNKVSQLTTNCGSMQSTLTTHTNQISRLATNSGTMNTTLTTHTNQITQLGAVSASQANQISRLASNSGTMQTTINTHTNQITQLGAVSASMNSTLTTHTNQISRLASNSGTMNTTLTTHTNQINQLGAVSASMNTTLTTHTNQISRLSANSGTQANQISQLTTNSGTMASTLSNKMDTTTANSTFVHKTGDTMTGVLTMKANMYEDAYNGALNMSNSDIYGLNSIYTADASDTAAEGIHFYRDATHVDTLRAAGGNLKFFPNRTVGSTAGSEYNVYHTGNLTISNYATYSALNSASGALNTRIATLESHDAMVKQENVTSANYRPLLFSTNYNAAQASIPTTTVTGQTYFNKEIYAQPSTGELGATQMKVGGHVTLKYNTSTQALDFIFS